MMQAVVRRGGSLRIRVPGPIDVVASSAFPFPGMLSNRQTVALVSSPGVALVGEPDRVALVGAISLECRYSLYFYTQVFKCIRECCSGFKARLATSNGLKRIPEVQFKKSYCDFSFLGKIVEAESENLYLGVFT